MDANYQYKQIITLLTDGLNTQDCCYASVSVIQAIGTKLAQLHIAK
jgi:hypothetical protein